MSPETTAAKKKRLQAIVKIFQKIDPHPKCELYFETPFQLLVSVVLSAQTTDKSVNRCMTPLYKDGLTPQGILGIGETGLLEQIKTIGLAPTKSKRVLALSKILLEKWGGEVPGDRAALESLPGVGRKTASVVLAEIFNEPVLAVDTHVFRVGFRLGLHAGKNVEEAEKSIVALAPEGSLPRLHHWLILHGRRICQARKPQCGVCPVADFCPSRLPADRQ